jgi:hypothetical protein
MKRIGIITTLLVALLLVAPAHAQSPACQGLEVHAAQLTFSNRLPFSSVSVTPKGTRSPRWTGAPSASLKTETPITSFTLESQTAHDGQPVQTVPLVNGGTFTLVTTGASIGIVFDASQLLNGTGAGAGDHLGAARAAIEAFLLEPGDPPPPRTRSPGNMERVALFIPADQPAQALQPDGLPGFTQDRYAVINTLRQNLPVRQGKTSLNAAIQAAIDATARDAQENGGKAVVLVVSDGGDALTGDSFNSLISQASQKQVKIVAFGIGTDKALQNNGFRLKQLAEATGGIYLERPDANSAGSALPARGAITTGCDLYRALRYPDHRRWKIAHSSSRSGYSFWNAELSVSAHRQCAVTQYHARAVGRRAAAAVFHVRHSNRRHALTAFDPDERCHLLGKQRFVRYNTRKDTTLSARGGSCPKSQFRRGWAILRYST